MIRIGSNKPALHSSKPKSTWTFHLQTPLRWHSLQPKGLHLICQFRVPNNLGASGPRGITCGERVALWDETSGARRDIGNRPQRVKHEHICSINMSHDVLFKTILMFCLQLEWEIDRPNTEVGFGIFQIYAVNLTNEPENIQHDQVPSESPLSKNRLHTDMSVF